MTDDRQPKPNVAVAQPPNTTDHEGSGGPRVVEVAKPKKQADRKPRAAKEAAKPAMKLPRLGEVQRLVLVSLPTISVTELAERLDLSRPSTSRALHGLATVGLVSSTDGQVPGWKSPWRLTKLGERAAAELSFDSVRRLHELIVNRPHNLPTAAEEIMLDAEARLGTLL